MKTKQFILASIFSLLSLSLFAKETAIDELGDKTEEVFTAKDKSFLQQWHYDQVLRMELNEEQRDAYHARLSQYAFKMSSLGLPKYSYTNTERKQKFNKLVEELDITMKDLLSSNNYAIHQEAFNQILDMVYVKRDWDK